MFSESENHNIAIRVKDISKRYEIYINPSDRLKQFLLPKILHIIGRNGRRFYKEFWALKNISFEIKKGDTIGIIGRNGSGKSTLLQIICGTLTPTTGNIEINGKVAALLELGSGFNPEFSGKDNVYLNASVLGLTQEQIDQRFDQIVAFADIGDFIDQPVKTYSSGMMVRLAFAVIANVDADILVIDEALAVGDAVFTQKCMEFIRKFQNHGSLIFVSHDISAVQSLCRNAIWLKNGEIALIDSAKKVSEAYLQFTLQEIYGDKSQLISSKSAQIEVPHNEENLEIMKSRNDELGINYESRFSVIDNSNLASGWETGEAKVLAIKLSHIKESSRDFFEGGEAVRLSIIAKSVHPLKKPILGFLFRDRLGQDLFGENTLSFTERNLTSSFESNNFEAEFDFVLPMLPNGQYAVMCSIAEGNLESNIQHHWMYDALIVNVHSSKVRWGLVGIPFIRVELKVNI